jgi:hypothetical protein
MGRQMTDVSERFPLGQRPARHGCIVALVVSLELVCAASASTANAGLYHYPWCETIRDRCYAKAKVRKAECNWRFNAAKKDQVNGLSKWPTGTSNFCRMYPSSQ